MRPVQIGRAGRRECELSMIRTLFEIGLIENAETELMEFVVVIDECSCLNLLSIEPEFLRDVTVVGVRNGGPVRIGLSFVHLGKTIDTEEIVRRKELDRFESQSGSILPMPCDQYRLSSARGHFEPHKTSSFCVDNRDVGR